VTSVGWAVWVSGPGWATPAFVVVAAAGAALAVIDARTQRLPDAITLPAVTLTAPLLGTAAMLSDGGVQRLSLAATGAVLLGGGYLLLHLVNRNGLGLGDVKLAMLLDMPAGWLGWTELWAMLLTPFLLGGLTAAALVLTRRATARTTIAFGPHMLLGAMGVFTTTRLMISRS